jgi:PmbA protein
MSQRVHQLIETISDSFASRGKVTWDLFVTKEQNRQLTFRNQENEDYKESLEWGYGVRLLSNDRISLVYGSDFDKKAVDDSVAKACFILDFITPNEFFRMNDTLLGSPSNKVLDDSYHLVSIEDKMEKLSELEHWLVDEHSETVKVEHLGFDEGVQESYYANSTGKMLFEKSAYYGFDADIIVSNNDGEESGAAFDYRTTFKDIDRRSIAVKSFNDAVSLIGASSAPSGNRSVIFRNNVMSSFLSFFSSLFSAEAMFQNRSVLKGKLGESIASDCFDLVDDPTLDTGLNSFMFDGEGSSSQVTSLISGGRFTHALYDLKSAAREGVLTTGNGVRGSYQSSPNIRPSNFIVAPGSLNYDELIKKMDQGVIITSVLGMHTSNRVNGDFSLGATGYLVENGVIFRPLKQITISGNYLELLKNIVAIGSDQFSFPYGGNILTPSVLFESISVSGE